MKRNDLQLSSDLYCRLATICDLPYIEYLRRSVSECIGFIPKQRYEMEINQERHGVILVIEENSELVGFAYGTFGGQSAKIQQIAIQEDARRLERASELVRGIEMIGRHRGFYAVSCRCAEDLESNEFWLALGFICVGQVDSKSVYSHGREKWSRRGRKLNQFVKTDGGLWLPGEWGIRTKNQDYPRTLANRLQIKVTYCEIAARRCSQGVLLTA